MKKNNYHIFAGILFLFLMLSSNSWSQSNVVITEVLYDTPFGERNEDLDAHNGEFVELYNPTNRTIDFSGWRLLTGYFNKAYSFPQGTKMEPGAYLIVAYRNANTPGFQLRSVYPQAIERGNNKIIYQNEIFLANNKSQVKLVNNRYQVVDAVFYSGASGDAHDCSPVWKLQATNWRKVSTNPLSIQRTKIQDVYPEEASGSRYDSENENYFTVAPCTPFSFADERKTPTLGDTPGNPQTPSEFGENIPLENDDFTGNISGNIDVSPTGAATYEIPLSIPPGTAGMQPNLSLIYNSQSGDGQLGLKWGLAGTSAISRVDKNIFYNGSVSQITYNSNPSQDALALDGNRLVYNYSDGIYTTIMETFCRITLSGSGKDAWFTVENKDGQTLEYGKTPDSKLYASGKDNPIAWRLNKVTDANGNYMLYSYSAVNGESVLDKITYTGNSATTLTPYNTITFNYKKQNTPNPQYIAGGTLEKNNILTSIQIECEEHLVKEYNFDYDDESCSYPRLTNITEKFDENTSSSLTINWGSSKREYIKNSTPLKDIPAEQIFTGDFDGDGVDDILTYSNKQWKLSKGGGEASINITLTNQPEGFDVTATQIGDFNGDGKKDLVLFGSNSCSIYYFENGIFNFVKSVTTNDRRKSLIGNFTNESKDQIFVASSMIISLDAGNNYTSKKISSSMSISSTAKLLAMNVNGDSYTDMGILEGKKLNIYVFEKNDFKKLNTLEFSTEDIFVADMNGNGLSDIVNAISDTAYDIYYGQGDGNYTKVSSSGLISKSPYDASGYDVNEQKLAGGQSYITISITNINCCYKQYIVKDFNGDGKADILEIVNIYKPSNAIFNNAVLEHDFYNRGCGVPAPFNPASVTSVQFLLNSNCRDTYLTLSAAYKRTHFYLHLTGGGTISWNNFSGNDNINAFETIGDFNGDGNLDFTCAARNGIYTFCNAAASSDFLSESITDNSLKESTNINYTYASNKSVHTQGTGAIFPYNDFAGALPIVSSIETPDGIGGKSKTEYTYSGLTLHRQGRGLLGFKSITAKNNTLNIIERTDYTETSSKLKSWLPCFTYVSTIGGASISSSSKQYAYKGPASIGCSGFDYLQQDITTNYLLYNSQQSNYEYDPISICKYQQSNYEYDLYGNITLSTTYYSDNEICRQAKNTYVTRGAWCPSKLQSTTFFNNYNKDDSRRTVNYFYDLRGNLLNVETDPGKEKWTVTTYTPNMYGLPTSITVSAKNETPRSKSYVYDPKCRFITGKQNELGQLLSLQYDPRFGVVLSEKNLTTGLETKMGYDILGRLRSITAPDGNITNIGIMNPDKSAPPLAKYYTLTETPGNPYSKVYYDIFGRAIRQETQGFDSKISVDKIYNSKGQLEKVSDPYQSSPSTYSEYRYDNIGRIEEKKYQSLTTKYDYIGDKIKTTNPLGQFSTKRFDQLGNVVEIEDNEGERMWYYYTATGQLQMVMHNSRSMVYNTYDEYDRPETTTDIDAGMIQYEYNAFGELVKQIDAKGNTFTMQYDNLGRITDKVSPEGKTSYEYYTDNNKAYNGLLKQVSGSGNMQNKYEYDALGRLTTYTDVIEGKEFKTGYNYDAHNHIRQMIYPSGFTIENHYNDAGYLYNITNVANSRLIWEMKEVDAMGAVKKVLNGNGLTTEYDYDSYGMPTSIKTGNIQHLTYGIDPVSRQLIASRKDELNNQTESFHYDNYNRLYSAKTGSGTEKLIGFDNNGNINSKYDFGTFHYDQQKIHAVDTVFTNLTLSNQRITYTAFNKVSSIEQANRRYDFRYGTDEQRRKMVGYSAGTLNLTRYYTLNYEKDELPGGATRETHYIPTPTGLSAVFIKENGNTGDIYYLCTDHLGSITAVTGANGLLRESYSYDAWGRKRKSDNWDDYNMTSGSNSNSLLYRGYTGHEHLDDVGLINMNGRMYDPLLGRMLSPDNQIPNPFSLGGYNRYSYAMNNPMTFIDPDGENPIAWALAAIIWIGKLWDDGRKANNGQSNPTKWDWKNANYTVGYNSSGNTAWGSVGWGNNYGVALGYRWDGSQWLGGYSQNGTTYLAPINQQYNAPEQAANNAVNNARQEYFDNKNIEAEWKSYTDLGAIAVESLGAGFSANAGMRYSSFPGGNGFWVGKNGITYDLSLAGKNGGYMRSASMAEASTALGRGIGNTLGVATTLYSGVSFLLNPNWEDGIGTVAGAAGYVYWPISVGYSYGYGAYLYGEACTSIYFNNAEQMREIISSNDSFWEQWMKILSLPRVPAFPDPF